MKKNASITRSVFAASAATVITLALFLAPGLMAMDLVRDGKPAAAIIIPANAPQSVHYAAQELNHHIKKSTGAALEVVTEDAADKLRAQSRIHLGNTRAARSAGIDVATLAAESFTLRTTDDALIIAGRDGPGDPLNSNTSAGTLFGVYEFLQRQLGVVWAWPGELGAHVPRKSNITVAASLDIAATPPFFQRHARHGLGYTSAHPALGFTPAAAADYAREQTVFLRRNRMGRAEKFAYGHAFTNWWPKYGAEHPEWFQFFKGKRGPATPKSRYSMCVSNPGLHEKIVSLWLENTGGKSNYINIVENDIVGLCECERCVAWDGPTPPNHMRFYAPNSKVAGTRFVSDRYARFALAVQQLAAKHNPDVNVVGYVYFNYFQAPTSGVKLNEHILLGFCPSGGWYPRSPEEHAWHQATWKGWRDAGARLFMRTNYFLDGYCMPHIFARQFADDFQHAARNGMVGTDFDSLTGQWAAQGPSLYLLMALHTRPGANVDALLAEYYSVFGAAAPHIKAYFDYWENRTMTDRERINAIFANRVASRWRSWAKAAHRVFPEETLAASESHITHAAQAVANDPEALARVNFLRTGLQHAILSARVCALLTTADAASTPERGQAALLELVRFRRAHERKWFSNLNQLAWVEEASWKLTHETKQEPDNWP